MSNYLQNYCISKITFKKFFTLYNTVKKRGFSFGRKILNDCSRIVYEGCPRFHDTSNNKVHNLLFLNIYLLISDILLTVKHFCSFLLYVIDFVLSSYLKTSFFTNNLTGGSIHSIVGANRDKNQLFFRNNTKLQ